MSVTRYPHTRDKETLWRGVFKGLKGKSVLQVGARPGGSWESFFGNFAERGFTEFHVLEAHAPNWRKVQYPGLAGKLLADVRYIDKLCLPQYDVLVWHHGPENVERDEFIKLVPSLQRVGKVVYVGMPHGKWEQGAFGGNPYEIHRTHWMPEDVSELGFDVHCFGEAGKKTPMFGVLQG